MIVLLGALLLATVTPASAAVPAVTAAAEATPAGGDKWFYVGAGALAFNSGQFANQATGETGFSAQLMPDLALTARLPFASAPDWGMSGLLAYTPLGRKTPDGGITTTVLRLEGALTRKIVGPLEARLGVGLANAIITGKGETVEMNNGNGTSTFGYPAGSSVSQLLYWTGGVEAEIVDSVLLHGTVFMMGPLSSNRSLSYSLLVSYGVL